MQGRSPHGQLALTALQRRHRPCPGAAPDAAAEGRAGGSQASGDVTAQDLKPALDRTGLERGAAIHYTDVAQRPGLSPDEEQAYCEVAEQISQARRSVAVVELGGGADGDLLKVVVVEDGRRVGGRLVHG